MTLGEDGSVMKDDQGLQSLLPIPLTAYKQESKSL